ncbi:hypothetical protein LSUB1_G008432 [Lachnellula subtilissima]|uniref:Fungal STAND N-terminal Goodbye domain-containing protein n=1 Tax=Lachnellula subtilissima TaxID=602034 RepID=A0A8H8U2Z6_9HELO|nr:hypothetical protein LSUB1_G008432 [Lachnellula subtilissima]
MDVQRPVWFEENEAEGAKSQVLPPPNDILKTHQEFKRKLRKALKIGSKEVQIASTKEELETQIEAVRNRLSPPLLALQNLDDADKAHDVYTEYRKKGPKRVGRWAQDFANGFSQFVGAYSGIVDIVRSAGGPYGEVAYQSLSILLIVVVNKSANDTKIKDLLDDIRKSFPRLENWPQIYPTRTMKALVATAYEQVTEFSRAAAYYFTNFWRRFAMAIIAPPSMVVDKDAALIHKTLAEISSEAMFGLHGRSHNIETQVVRSQQTIEQLEAQATSSNEKLKKLQDHAKRIEDTNDWLLMALKDQNKKFERYKKDVEQRAQQEDEQQLKTLQENLGVMFPSAETNVEKTKYHLMQVFPNLPHYAPHLPETAYVQMSRDLLQKASFYHDWISSTESSLLFLSGRTAIEGRHYRGWRHCWLSPASIYIAEDLASSQDNNHIIAFFSCHPEFESRTVSTNHIISSIVLQILQRHPHVLRKKAVQFQSAALSGAMMELLSEVLACVKEFGTTYIVLDRLDQCEGKFNLLMDRLVRLVGDPGCDVKIAVIAETSIGGGKWHPEYLPEGEYRLDHVFGGQAWNQARLTNLEMNRGDRALTWTSEGSTLTLVETT